MGTVFGAHHFIGTHPRGHKKRAHPTRVVTMSSPSRLRSRVARADLLRSLAVHERSSLTLDQDVHTWFGYIQQVVPEVTVSIDLPISKVSETTSNQPHSTPPPAPILQLSEQWLVTEHEVYATEAEAETFPLGAVMDEEMAQAESKYALATQQDLLPWARLLPALLKPVRKRQPRGLDVPRWVEQWAQCERQAPWPRRQVARLPEKLVVILDFSERLWPYRWDMHRLCRRLLALFGQYALSLRIFANGPQAGWTDWLLEQDPARMAELQHWQAPAKGTPILIVSDLGSHSPHSSVVQSWLDFVQSLPHQPVFALAPVGKEHTHLPVFDQLPVLRWSGDASMHFSQRGQHSPVCESALNELLAMISVTRRVDPPLLRALRKLNSSRPHNAALEASVWNHPDIVAGGVCLLKTEAATLHQQHFSSLPITLKQLLFKVRQTHHSHFRAGLNHEENLLLDAHSGQTIPELKQQVIAARSYASSMLASAQQGEKKWQYLAQQWLERADAKLYQAQRDLFEQLTFTLAQTQGKAPSATQPYWLVHDAASNTIQLQNQAAELGQSHMAGPIAVSYLALAMDNNPVELCTIQEKVLIRNLNLPGGQQIKLRTGKEQLTLGRVARPHWVQEWGRNRDGLYATIPDLGVAHAVSQEQLLNWAQRPTEVLALMNHRHAFTGTSYTLKLDHIGIFCELTIKGITQILRYIPHGQFLMGSPDSEPERDSDEDPQHWVTISAGFWFADTACTQALWQVVMGSNPSHFKGDDLPVENVSWDDVQQFLAKLQALLPAGVEAVLPTEAQWEYACRAGTQTPFSFGDNISTDQVNYDGNYPYNHGTVGEYRRQTVVVRALPANSWGLYQMHGNVWEWCADGQREYTRESLIDPSGLCNGSMFVVRGGGWFFRAQGARAARRHRRRCSYHDAFLGFRFVLKL